MVHKIKSTEEFEFLGEYDLDKLLRLKEALNKEIKWAREEAEYLGVHN